MNNQSSSDGVSPAKIRKIRHGISVPNKHVPENKDSKSLDKPLDSAETKQLDIAAISHNPDDVNVQLNKNVGDNHNDSDNVLASSSDKFLKDTSTGADDPNEANANLVEAIDNPNEANANLAEAINNPNNTNANLAEAIDPPIKADSLSSSLNKPLFHDDNDPANTSEKVQQNPEPSTDQEPKRFDATKLKEAIWNSLVCVNSKDDFDEEDNTVLRGKKLDHVSFGAAYERLPEHLPAEMGTLSFPMAFEALLHLATEQSLTLEGQSDLLDCHVSSDK